MISTLELHLKEGPKAPSPCALVLPQVEEAVAVYLEDTDNDYCFEVVQKQMQ